MEEEYVKFGNKKFFLNEYGTNFLKKTNDAQKIFKLNQCKFQLDFFSNKNNEVK